MVRRFVVFVLALLVGPTAVSCAPQVGKSCSLSTDCSPLGDRLCDSSQPGGYCTVFACQPDTCPNSICVAFDLTTVDPACGRSLWSRFEQSYCLAPCNSDGDCRSEYECVDLSTEAEQTLRIG